MFKFLKSLDLELINFPVSVIGTVLITFICPRNSASCGEPEPQPVSRRIKNIANNPPGQLPILLNLIFIALSTPVHGRER